MKKERISENIRKQRRRAVNRPALQFLKQVLYFKATGKWIENPRKLHWHHVNPSEKYLKISWLSARSPERIARELIKCEVLHEDEHRRIHRRRAGQ